MILVLVIVTENASLKLRGELTKWVLEVKAGVFVGKTSATVREKLWEKVKHDTATKGALLVYSMDTEQGYQIEIYGDPRRTVIDLDGVKLIKTPLSQCFF